MKIHTEQAIKEDGTVVTGWIDGVDDDCPLIVLEGYMAVFKHAGVAARKQAPIEGSKAKLSVSGVNGTLADFHEVDANNYVLALCPRIDHRRFGAGKPSFNTFQLSSRVCRDTMCIGRLAWIARTTSTRCLLSHCMES